MLTDIAIALLVALLLETIGILSEYLKSFLIIVACLCWLTIYLINGYSISFIGKMDLSMWIACVAIFDTGLSCIFKTIQKKG